MSDLSKIIEIPIEDISSISGLEIGSAALVSGLSVPAGYTAGDRGVFFGGIGRGNVIDYVTISTTGNAQDFGDLTVRRTGGNAACSNGSNDRGVCAGDENDYTNSRMMDYINISTTGNATAAGIVAYPKWGFAGTSNATNNRGIWWPARFGLTGNESNYIEYITINNITNAFDFGDTSIKTAWGGACSNGTNDRGLYALGLNLSTTGRSNRIEYITISSTSNSSSFGQLNYNADSICGISNGTNNRGIFAGGATPTRVNNISYVTITSTGNGVDFGDLSQARSACGGASNGTNNRGVFGGSEGTFTVNIEYINILSTGNGTSFGNLTTGSGEFSATSDA